jgi:outer membrane protein assembly factor BamB
LLIVTSSIPLAAQTDRNGSASSGTISGAVFPSPERALIQKLTRVRELLAGERDSDAVPLLVAILESDNDSFIPTGSGETFPDGRGYLSLKNESRKILGRLRPAARESYENQFGPTARRMLDRAPAGREIEMAAEVVRRFPHTRAGDDALNLLGNFALDRGRFVSAAGFFGDLQTNGDASRFEPSLSIKLAVCWERVGETGKARGVLVSLQNRFPNARLQVGGQPVELFRRPEDALIWLQAIAGDRRKSGATGGAGGASRPVVNGESDVHAEGTGATIPTNAIWTQPLCESLELEATLQEQRADFAGRSIVAFPTLMPAVVDNVVVMRTPQALVAVDFTTGKRIWQTDPSEYAESPATSRQADVANGAASLKFEQRVWSDMTYGSLSCDRNAVFAVEDSGQKSDQGGGANPVLGTDRHDNRLSAYALRDRPGRRVWSVDGLEFDGTSIERCVFLGPPLVLDGQLFVLAESRGAVLLVVLEAETGNLDWAQPLVLTQTTPDVAGLARLTRHASGLSPSYSEGILVCPTGCGAVVAVDLPTRSLRWACRFPDAIPNQRQLPPGNRWTDSRAVISDQTVLITPVESGRLYCLNLDNGGVQWSRDRSDLIYIAGVDRNLAVAVGSKQIVGIDIETGQPAPDWTLVLPTNTLPSGRGCFSGRQFLLPVSSAGKGAIVTIRLDVPAFVECTPCGEGVIPGNLLSHRGRILSQGVDWLHVLPFLR